MRYLKLPNLEAGRGYDKDELMLEACFQLLVDFIEDEHPGERIEWSATEDHAEAWATMQSLYKWWTEERPARMHPVDDVEWDLPPLEDLLEPATVGGQEVYRYTPWDNPEWLDACKEARLLEREWLAEDQANLHRLIDVRRYMWV